MYVLDEDYFAISDSKEDLKDFFKSKFYVSDLAEENFYVHVVRTNLSDIFRLTSDSSDRDGSKNIDFIHYLDDNFKEEYLELVSTIRSDEYYVNMMIAWFFATALAKQWDAAVKYL